jgi:GNAT superfamily N-acetyltransferase
MDDERPLMLDDGRVVAVRSVRPDDADRLYAFFAALSADAQRFRFFSPRRVGPDEAARMADLSGAGRGSVAVVATTATAGGDEVIVGDARSCGPHGSVAEMAIAVADAFQGCGLGGVLLEELAGRASAAGIETFTASVLADNVRMCRLLQSWGFAIVDRDGTHVVHLAMATDGTFPQWWPPGEGPKVLIEGRGWLGRLDELALRDRGYNVAVCLGPPSAGQGTHGCPVLAGDRCPMVDSADALVFSLPLRTEAGRRLLRTHTRRGNSPPVCVELPAPLPAGDRRQLRGHPVVAARAAEVVAAVDDLLRDAPLS